MVRVGDPRIRPAVLALLLGGMALCSTMAAESGDEPMQIFQQLLGSPWQEVVRDPGTGDWTRHWFLDGGEATVTNTPRGMELRAGPTPGDDAGHAVLWTRKSFSGDVKIEYEFTRLDEMTQFVVILYLQATGSGVAPYVEDLASWRELRAVPAMRTYFNHVNTYHISYAAFDHGNTDPGNDYIRARRYLPESGKGLEGTDLRPSYDHTGLFATGVPCHLTIIKAGQQLFLQVKGPDRTRLCHWDNRELPPITAGRIGLRHMYTRQARYRDIRISVRAEDPPP